MRLFIRDHVSLIVFFIATILGLPWLLEYLDGFEKHYFYFIFLTMTALLVYLGIRYLRRSGLYNHLQRSHKSDQDYVRLRNTQSLIEKRYKQEMEKYFLDLEDLRAEEKKNLEVQNLIVSNSVHQIKTPLAVMNLLLENDSLENKPSSFSADLKAEVLKIDYSLNQLLSLNRSSQLLTDVLIQQIQLHELVKEVVNELKTYFVQAGVFPKVQIDPATFVYSDRKWLKEVLYQVISNSIKYANASSTVEITFSNIGVLDISNQGRTIPENEIERIFELFYTGTVGREFGEATGIGLYMVKKILTTLNHSYRISSQNGKTTFSIDLST
ncbi:HAMP domain-containing sensor histidine kinase [Enterococcus devriesei]|uniref:sensor histidine kinase n=1 Tax=Enterococcus devriesei TaxID=319970 RepID=UPI00288F66E7|nr:HAMP domain-containing sensor histidine kinase [Enterococcus devriesei]MDT2821914.1 HAMP domain-containing sensor histidine kinase [Enterococcus devriesei]